MIQSFLLLYADVLLINAFEALEWCTLRLAGFYF